MKPSSNNPDTPQPPKPQMPPIDGTKVMAPLEMNAVRFNKQHTVLTPDRLRTLASDPQSSDTKTD